MPWPPGDPQDVLTRMIAETLQQDRGVPAPVVNKPGGGGPFPGAAEVAMAEPDGYTVGSLVVGVPIVGTQTGIPALNPNPFEPVGLFPTYPFVIAAAGDAPCDTMEDLAAYAQENGVALGHFGSVLIPTQVTMALAETMGFAYASDAAFDAPGCSATDLHAPWPSRRGAAFRGPAMSRMRTLHDLFRRDCRPGDLVFAASFCALALALLAALPAQTAWVDRTGLFAQPAFWPAVSGSR